MSEATTRAGWSGRLMDVLTIGVAVMALWVAADRFVLHKEAPQGSNAVAEENALRGTRAAPVPAVLAASGQERTLAFTGTHRRLVVLFRSDCPACQRTKPTWEALAAAAPQAGPVLALTAEPRGVGTGQAFFSKGHEKDVVVAHAPRMREAFAASYVPVTMVLSPTGTVEFVRIGVPSGTDVDSVRALLAAGR